MHRRKSAEKVRKVTPPSPSYMDNSQFAAYLADLRNNRVTRPGGARPLPSTTNSTTRIRNSAEPPKASLDSALSSKNQTQETIDHGNHSMAPARLSCVSTTTTTLRTARSTVNEPQSSDDEKDDDQSYHQSIHSGLSNPSEVLPSATYIERGQRWMEKEEAGSLRQAMDDMKLKDKQEDLSEDEERRVYDAALDEASELVWQHRHGRPPQPDAPYRYKPHMRKHSYQHARTASVGKTFRHSFSAEQDDNMYPPRASEESHRSLGARSPSPSNPYDTSRDMESTRQPAGTAARHYQRDASLVASTNARRSSMKRNISGEIQRPFSGDQIWEEPDSAPGAAQPTRSSKSNDPSTSGMRGTHKPISGNDPAGGSDNVPRRPKLPWLSNRSQQSPTQSRNPLYVTNTPVTNSTQQDISVPKKNGLEVRSEDIRNATTMRLKDRSPKLPTPSAVSDSPGRPIVSFDVNWKAPEETTDQQSGPPPNTIIPDIVVAQEDDKGCKQVSLSQPASPSISVQDADETTKKDTNIPKIIIQDDNSNTPPAPARPLPVPGQLPASTRHGSKERSHWSPSQFSKSRSTATCHECGYPIEGRFVALAGIQERFHPHCFRCYTCGTSLEALEISPEPSINRQQRLDRIKRRARGDCLEEVPGETREEDGDGRLRFFCHLDWHELYAPRCKHCKTPILGEHIVALGQHWHYGHFFCAECGDPFEKGMTHIEKDGYAWCVNCQTRRTERRAPKCKKCALAVVGQYVKALGGEWHETCFRCTSCNGGFDDGQIFPREERGELLVLCTTCRQNELKA